jgi:hypothetical protein
MHLLQEKIWLIVLDQQQRQASKPKQDHFLSTTTKESPRNNVMCIEKLQ